jgi:hypothetical protein
MSQERLVNPVLPDNKAAYKLAVHTWPVDPVVCPVVSVKIRKPEFEVVPEYLMSM